MIADLSSEGIPSQNDGASRPSRGLLRYSALNRCLVASRKEDHRMSSRPVSSVLVLFTLVVGQAWATAPELPRVFLDTTLVPPTGATITVASGGDFQAALNAAQPGDVITLQAGATFTGPFTLPDK